MRSLVKTPTEYIQTEIKRIKSNLDKDMENLNKDFTHYLSWNAEKVFIAHRKLAFLKDFTKEGIEYSKKQDQN